MSRRTSARLRALTGVVALALAAPVITAVGPGAGPAAAAGEGQVTIIGRGYGHGRGMGQYGALGYAVDRGWSYQQIVAYYYGGTTLQANAGNPGIDVELVNRTGADTAATGSNLTVNGVAVGATSVKLVPNGSGGFVPYVSSSVCGEGGGTWTQWGGALASGATIASAGSATVTLCDSTMKRTYRGTLMAVWTQGTSYTFNRVATEDYLRGVVPRESPASWGDLGGGRGLEALKAQSVAARGYALSSSRPSGATTCDTTTCQVYLGYAEQPYGGSVKLLEDGRTDNAIGQTSGQVMRTSGGAIARTEFSSSTGGWTAGGTFPAVEDLGDSTASNPNRTWSTTLGLPAVASALGTGPIASIKVTARNGLGADGGRATTVTVVTTAGASQTFSGSTVRSKLGLKSDWFTLSAVSSAEASKVVTALYADILGRQPDAGGLAMWTGLVMQDGGGGRVASGIVNSTERLHTFVTAEYRAALKRDPEPAGLDFWTQYLQNGTTVPELQAFIYSSDEGKNVLGRGDVGTWVDGVYAGILGRSAGASERAFWAGQVGAVGYAQVVRSIAKSDEAGMIRLNRYYGQMLGRSADPSGIGTFLPLMAGNGDIVLPVHLGSSPEYWNRAQTR
ncbi:hypothetical protein AGMMS50218_11690 [Actinomycetota bacterium]|nr:hypothetical protein AGMMS50218_11690 [Actinomycetota bacterium]